jgi:hypothetical protein
VKKPRRVPVDWVGLHKLPGADKKPLQVPKSDVADEVEVLSTRFAPPAHSVFSPNELEARIEVYAEIVAQGLSLFGDEAEEDEPPRNECWGCGCKTPLRENGWRMMPAVTPGWVLIPVGGGSRLSEIWCPDCAAMTGPGCSRGSQ